MKIEAGSNNQNPTENLSKESVEEIRGGADELERLNADAENAKTPEEREKALVEASKFEEQLDMLERELGFSEQEAKEVIVSILEGNYDLSKEMQEVQGGMMERFKNMILTADRQKALRIGALAVLMNMGALMASAMPAFGKDASAFENMKLTNASLWNEKAPIALIKINQLENSGIELTHSDRLIVGILKKELMKKEHKASSLGNIAEISLKGKIADVDLRDFFVKY